MLGGLLPTPVTAQVAVDDSFRYLEPQEPEPLRAAGLVGLYLVLQFADYQRTTPPSGPAFATDYTPWDKLAHGAVSWDTSAFRTNFGAHPLLGTLFYQFARGSRLPAWQASLYAVVGSTTWELIEFHEKASINDLVVTPTAGIALGETLFQLSAHFDRSPPGTANTVLAWLTAPWKKANDAIDGAALARGDPADVLQSGAWLGGGAASGDGWTRGELRLAGGWKLVRDPEYGAPGRVTHRWVDGQVSGLAFELATGSGGLSDARLESVALLASLYRRELDAAGDGSDQLAGVGAGFAARGHAWRPGLPFDLLALVELPRARLEGRWMAGSIRLTARLDAAALLGGMRSLALDTSPPPPPPGLPTSQQQLGYHFGIGGALAPAVELLLGPARLTASWRGDAAWGRANPDPMPGYTATVQLDDRWQEALAAAGWHFTPGLDLAAEAGWRGRWSRAGATEATASERRWGLSLGWSSGR